VSHGQRRVSALRVGVGTVTPCGAWGNSGNLGTPPTPIANAGTPIYAGAGYIRPATVRSGAGCVDAVAVNEVRAGGMYAAPTYNAIVLSTARCVDAVAVNDVRAGASAGTTLCP